jgi:hypothetical protein
MEYRGDRHQPDHPCLSAYLQLIPESAQAGRSPGWGSPKIIRMAP